MVSATEIPGKNFEEDSQLSGTPEIIFHGFRQKIALLKNVARLVVQPDVQKKYSIFLKHYNYDRKPLQLRYYNFESQTDKTGLCRNSLQMADVFLLIPPE